MVLSDEWLPAQINLSGGRRMKADLDLKKEPLRLGTVLNIVMTGYTVGLSVITVPVMVLAVLGSLLSEGPFSKDTGAGVLALVLVPLILFMQSVIIGLTIAFGLRVYRWFHGLRSR
jgi:hypothetical protein